MHVDVSELYMETGAIFELTAQKTNIISPSMSSFCLSHAVSDSGAKASGDVEMCDIGDSIDPTNNSESHASYSANISNSCLNYVVPIPPPPQGPTYPHPSLSTGFKLYSPPICSSVAKIRRPNQKGKTNQTNPNRYFPPQPHIPQPFAWSPYHPQPPVVPVPPCHAIDPSFVMNSTVASINYSHLATTSLSNEFDIRIKNLNPNNTTITNDKNINASHHASYKEENNYHHSPISIASTTAETLITPNCEAPFSPHLSCGHMAFTALMIPPTAHTDRNEETRTPPCEKSLSPVHEATSKHHQLSFPADRNEHCWSSSSLHPNFSVPVLEAQDDLSIPTAPLIASDTTSTHQLFMFGLDAASAAADAVNHRSPTGINDQRLCCDDNFLLLPAKRTAADIAEDDHDPWASLLMLGDGGESANGRERKRIKRADETDYLLCWPEFGERNDFNESTNEKLMEQLYPPSSLS